MSSTLIPAWLDSVHHDGSQLYVSNLTPQLGETVGLRLRAAANAPIKRLFLRTFPDGEQALTQMTRGRVTNHAQWWEADLPIREPIAHYRFVIEAEDGVWWYTAAGPVTLEPRDHTDFRVLADYHIPSWLHESVFYQIFPDRFADGQPESNPQPHEYEYRGHHPQTYPWETPPNPEQPFSLVFYGRDPPHADKQRYPSLPVRPGNCPFAKPEIADVGRSVGGERPTGRDANGFRPTPYNPVAPGEDRLPGRFRCHSRRRADRAR